MNTEQLIESLLDPKTYPHPVEVITTIETHISIVFLTGQYAYKLKKPVNFGFLDFSSLNKRRKFCQLEVALNQRTAPDLYLGVYELQISNTTSSSNNDDLASSSTLLKIVPSQRNNENLQHKNNASAAIEYLVKMQQFNPNHVLGKMLKHDCVLDSDLLNQLALQISDFHKNAEQVNLDSELGKPKTQLQPMLDNLPTLFKHFSSQPEILKQINTLEKWTLTKFDELSHFINERRNSGFVKACHGDLHLDNIAIIDNSPLLFDGIEFNEHFRWIDCMSDLAFLLIDMEFRGKVSASFQVLSLYLSKTLDYKALNLLNFYRVYRALVRAKITALRSDQLEGGSFEQQQVITTAQQYIAQAHGYLQPNKVPKCILMQGISGSGKSHLANQVLEQLKLDAIIISSDRIRKTLFGINSTQRVTEEEKLSLYSNKMNQQTYQALLTYTEICLKNGFNVIVDATFLKKAHRQKFYDMPATIKRKHYLISMETTAEFAKQTILHRLQNNKNPSDADTDVMLKQIKVSQPPFESENAIQLKTEHVWQRFPKENIQEFLELPID